ncbi:hypothetical protein [Paenibacillus planticolens]|uniref:Uncharacterized protein n=1 Tax=Paenibacillus planticolens TaxID=2654976 RepID=A0ABX1ZMT4_9BACL|nr:hypothetical protein [Paenibacillus planticolens]NOV01396.1 hypothetical protein [Paenibacillus planticolens]
MIYLMYEGNDGTWYFEVDDEGGAARQVVVGHDGSVITSNIKHEQYHFFLADQPLSIASPDYVRIEMDIFEKVWNESIFTYT